MERLSSNHINAPVWGSSQFMREFRQLTGEQQARVRKAFILWRIGQFPKGLHCEKIHASNGMTCWTLRGTKQIRLFFMEQKEGFIFFSVNFHDYGIVDSMDWNAVSPQESLTSWDPAPDDKESARESAARDFDTDDDPDRLPDEYPLADGKNVSDRQLMDIGVLWQDLSVVRGIRDGDALLDLLETRRNTLPEKELYDIFDDPKKSTIEKLLRNRAKAGLLANRNDVDGGIPEELDFWRAAELDHFRRWCSPNQLEIITAESPGPMLVLGAAGTGKTVVALWRTVYLARDVFTGSENRLLLTCFSQTLAQDLQRQLDVICKDDPSTRKRIAVQNINDAMVEFVNANGGNAQLDFKRFDDRATNMMKRAAREDGYGGARTPEWLWKEYSQAVEAFGTTRSSDYIGRRLPGPEDKPDDSEKKKLWSVFQRFERIAEDVGFWTPGRLANQTIRLLREGPATHRFSAAVADETQDLSRAHLRFLAAVVGYDSACPRKDILTFFGDARQRIYRDGESPRSCGIRILAERTLGRNYRSTETIRRRAEKFLAGVPVDDLDGDLVVRDESPAARKGVPVEEARCENTDEEAKRIAETIRRWMKEDSRQPGSPKRVPKDYAVFCPTLQRVNDIHGALERNGMPARIVTAEKEPETTDEVRVMTLHRAKGLEYQGVVLDLDAQNWPLSAKSIQKLSPTERSHRENMAKCLAYVGLTRAIRRALITGEGPAPDGV